MIGCNLRGLTDAAFANLAGLESLDIESCTQLTGAAFSHLRGSIRSLK